MALLFAIKVIEGKWEFENVASLWKEEVRAILIAEGYEHLTK